MRSQRYFTYIVVVIFFNCVSTELNVYNDGWIPVSPERVLNQRRREIGYAARNTPVTLKNDVLLSNKADKIDTLFKKENIKTQNIVLRESLKAESDKVFQDLPVKERARKSKMIAEYILNSSFKTSRNMTKLLESEIEITTTPSPVASTAEYSSTVSNKAIDSIPDVSNTYEVTEDPNNYQKDIEKSNSFTRYQNIPTSMKDGNLIEKLWNILSKYDIKSNDVLQNYDLSLQNRAQSRSKAFYQRYSDKVPMIPYTYNNPNHMRLDPLLAVFLSNYGLYVPGLYGIDSNYSNLYGYLASNNIHNNKPFGLYKEFSDRDTSKV